MAKLPEKVCKMTFCVSVSQSCSSELSTTSLRNQLMFSVFSFVLHFLLYLPASSQAYAVSHLPPSLPPSLLPQQWQRKLCDPLKKVTGPKWNECGKKRKKPTKRRERSAGGSTRGLCCQLDTTQMERGWVRDISAKRQRERERERGGKERKTPKEWSWKYYRTPGERERRSGGG